MKRCSDRSRITSADTPTLNMGSSVFRVGNTAFVPPLGRSHSGCSAGAVKLGHRQA